MPGLAKPQSGGAVTVVMDWLRQIDRTQVMFGFVVTNPADLYDYEEEALALGARIIRAPLFGTKRIPLLASWWQRTFRDHPEWRIVHGHDALTTSIYLSVARAMGHQTIAHSHSAGGDAGLDGLIRRVLRWPLRRVAATKLACSNSAAVWMFGPRADCRNINNGINVERFAFDVERREAVRAVLGVGDAFVVGHVGRLVAVKNHTRMLRVFAELLKTEPSAHLLLVGEGRLRGVIETEIHSRGIGANVHLVGLRTDVPELLSAMDLLNFPSRYEGLGMALVEAQASGLPCVAADTVPRAVGLTDLVRFISLDLPDDDWVNVVLEARLAGDRVSRTDELRSAGYDSAQVAHEMQQFYPSLAESQSAKARR